MEAHKHTYTKNEIDLIHEPMNEKLDKILEQTTATNGRVGKLEIWRGFITGGIAVVIIIVVPLLIWALIILTNVGSMIQEGVNDELSKYEVIIE